MILSTEKKQISHKVSKSLKKFHKGHKKPTDCGSLDTQIHTRVELAAARQGVLGPVFFSFFIKMVFYLVLVRSSGRIDVIFVETTSDDSTNVFVVGGRFRAGL